MEAQSKATPQIYVGLDIGGTNNKIAILSQGAIDIHTAYQTQVCISNHQYNLYIYSTFSYQNFLTFLQQLKRKAPSMQVVGTGGGAISKAKEISEILATSIKPASEFQAHATGLQFYMQAGLPFASISFERGNDSQISIVEAKTTLNECPNLLVMSLGSGVNYQLYGQSEMGIQRFPAKDKKLTAGDGFFLEGTSLGAGFLMGLGRLWSGERNFNELLNLMKTESDLQEYYEAVLINLFLTAVNMALLHEQNCIFITGALLSYNIDLSFLFKRAIQFIQTPRQLKFKVVCLERLEGFLGAVGALQMAMK